MQYDISCNTLPLQSFQVAVAVFVNDNRKMLELYGIRHTTQVVSVVSSSHMQVSNSSGYW